MRRADNLKCSERYARSSNSLLVHVGDGSRYQSVLGTESNEGCSKDKRSHRFVRCSTSDIYAAKANLRDGVGRRSWLDRRSLAIDGKVRQR